MKKHKPTREERKNAIDIKFEGTGHYIYENKTSGHLTLPKPAFDGRKVVPPRGKFEGDSYFMQLVRPPMGLLLFIGEIKKEETEVKENKLILDQPDKVTDKGTVEHIMDNNTPIQRINDSVDNNNKPDVLLNEGPIDGIEIITR
jgi:hypothetical protein